MRNQSIVGSKLPDLSEAGEQEKGNSYCLLSCPRETASTFSRTTLQGCALPKSLGKSVPVRK